MKLAEGIELLTQTGWFLNVLHHKLYQVHHSHSMGLKFPVQGEVVDPAVPEGLKVVEDVGLDPEHVNEEGLAHAGHVLEEDALPGGHDDAFLCWFETQLLPQLQTLLHDAVTCPHG